MRFVCKLVLTLGCLPLLMGATIYRWVDADGIVNYTQIKPEGVEAELVSADTGRRISPRKPPPAATPSGDAQAPADDDQALSERQRAMLEDLRAAEARRQEEIARVREANCEQARQVLDRLTARGRIRVMGDDGVERVMPEEERQERIDEAQRVVAANCAGTASR